MVLQIVTVPCLTDNYAFLAHDPATGATAAIDVPEAAPILQALEKQGWTLSHILLTHHHSDHIDGVAALLRSAPARVIGAAADAHRLPPLDQAVEEGDAVRLGNETGHVIAVPGHTLGHVAYHFPDSRAVFTGDSLMALGCGRVFEGSMAQMHASLGKLAALPPATLVCSGHEYTQVNAKFALTIDPDNSALISRVRKVDALRAAGRASVPSSLADEIETNPFLRTADPSVRARLGLDASEPVEVFAEIRSRKDRF
jgi:hydroxyacylglutathione hydrolase